MDRNYFFRYIFKYIEKGNRLKKEVENRNLESNIWTKYDASTRRMYQFRKVEKMDIKTIQIHLIRYNSDETYSISIKYETRLVTSSDVIFQGNINEENPREEVQIKDREDLNFERHIEERREY